MTTRESPSVEIMEMLDKKGAVLSYSDPFVPVFPKLRRGRMDLGSVELTPEYLAGVDCVLLITDHDRFDYEAILKNSGLIVDTRGRFPHVDKVVRA